MVRKLPSPYVRYHPSVVRRGISSVQPRHQILKQQNSVRLHDGLELPHLPGQYTRYDGPSKAPSPAPWKKQPSKLSKAKKTWWMVALYKKRWWPFKIPTWWPFAKLNQQRAHYSSLTANALSSATIRPSISPPTPIPEAQPTSPVQPHTALAPQNSLFNIAFDLTNPVRIRNAVNEKMANSRFTKRDKIFLKQLDKMTVVPIFKEELATMRKSIARALAREEERKMEHAERDRAVEAERRHEEAARQREEAERQRREAEAERRREEAERQREEAAAAKRNARIQSSKRGEGPPRLKEPQVPAKPSPANVQVHNDGNNEHACLIATFQLYVRKWEVLRSNETLRPLTVLDLPWPVVCTLQDPLRDITPERIAEFVHHPLRPDMEGKTGRDRVKFELLRFHPDKFDSHVLPRVVAEQRELASAVAVLVVHSLVNQLMS